MVVLVLNVTFSKRILISRFFFEHSATMFYALCSKRDTSAKSEVHKLQYKFSVVENMHGDDQTIGTWIFNIFKGNSHMTSPAQQGKKWFVKTNWRTPLNLNYSSTGRSQKNLFAIAIRSNIQQLELTAWHYSVQQVFM